MEGDSKDCCDSSVTDLWHLHVIEMRVLPVPEWPRCKGPFITPLSWRDSALRSAHRSLALPAMLPELSSRVDAAPALERPAEGDLVGVLQVAADGQTAGQPRDRQAERAD